MPKKQRSETCSSRWCRNHEFELKPLSSGLQIKRKLLMRFCPHFNNNLNKFSKSIPVLNRDNQFCTPTFILEDQQKFYEENTQRFLIKHQEKARQNESGISEILVPKQSANKNFCAVCQQVFPDYLNVNKPLNQHIEAREHKKAVNRSKVTGYIKEMQSKYKKLLRSQPTHKINCNSDACDLSNQITVMKDSLPERSSFVTMTKNQCQSEFI